MTVQAAYLRNDLDLTLDGLRDQMANVQRDTDATDVALGDVEFRLDGNISTIKVGDTEVPATEAGISAFGDFLGVPNPFLKRLVKMNLTASNSLLNAMREASQASSARVRMGDGGVVEVTEAGKFRISPVQIIDIAQRVVGTTSPVQRVIHGNAFGFDSHVPFDSSTGVGGDRDSMVDVPEALRSYSWASKIEIGPDAKVGDVTAAGLRFGMDVKHGLTPTVQPWMMRLVCTNGMETTDNGLAVDGRGLTVEEVLADLEIQAERAFSGVERQIEHFYALRNQPVTNPERMLRRLAAERGIPTRSLGRLEDLAPALVAPTMFDLTNLVTNLANSPQMRNDGGRLILERAGGSVVLEEVIRCENCHQKVVH